MNKTLTSAELAEAGTDERIANLEEENRKLRQIAHEVDRLRRENETMRSKKRLGLVWEQGEIEKEDAIDMAIVPHLILEEDGQKISRLEGDTGNLVIEGDNLDALRLLSKTHKAMVDCIYIDPPYNTGNTTFVYNDRFVDKEHRWRKSLWLDFLHKRLVLAHDLLSHRGVIMVSINDEHRALLELLMDEVMPGKKVGTFVWRCRTAGKSDWNFSDDHEHVLVYGNPGFRFRGVDRDPKDYKFKHPSGRAARTITLSKPHDYQERPNTFYAIHDPVQDCWYPCDPHRTWAYDRNSMEQLKKDGYVHFPGPTKTSPVCVFRTEKEFIDAVRAGDVPHAGKGAGRRPVFTPELIEEGVIDPSEWVGRRISWARPSKIDFLDEAKSATKVISSWMISGDTAAIGDSGEDMGAQLVANMTGEGTDDLAAVFGGKKVFHYAKPPSLLVSLIEQATSRDSIVLDFFAGSGTTAKAVMEANRIDGGSRRFIMVSSTEATDQEPEKNVCRNVCAQRIRAVCEGYGSGKKRIEGTGDGFAYLRLERVLPYRLEDALYDGLDSGLVWTLLQTQHGRPVTAYAPEKGVMLDDGGETAIALCPEINDEIIEILRGATKKPMVLYTEYPAYAAEKLAGCPIEARPAVDAAKWIAQK